MVVVRLVIVTEDVVVSDGGVVVVSVWEVSEN